MKPDISLDSQMGEYAGFVSRLVAYVLDQLILVGFFSIVTFVASFILGSIRVGEYTEIFVFGLVFLFNVMIYFVYYLGFWMLAGQTPGKSLMGLRIVRSDGDRLNLRRAIIRLAGYWLSATLLFLGYLMVLVDARRQALHDKLAGTLVIYSWSIEDDHVGQRQIRIRDIYSEHQRGSLVSQEGE